MPYLRSVASSDESSKGYITTVTISEDELTEKLQEAYPEEELPESLADDIEVIDITEGGRVKTLRVGNIIMKGTEFRSLLGLRSACFSISSGDEGQISITTTGHGHGVGMSQWGANALAKTGGTFSEILRHYYTGVDIVSISDHEASAQRTDN